MNSGIQESLTNVRVVKSFVREAQEIEKIQQTEPRTVRRAVSGLRIVITIDAGDDVRCRNATTLAAVWYGGNIIIAGKMPVGDLTAFTTYIVQILMSL